MRKTWNKWKSLNVYFRAFLILAFVFFAVGLGTLGSPRGTGDAYELRVQRAGDEQRPAVVFRLSEPTEKGEDGADETVHLRLKGVAVNLAQIYAGDGEPATLRVERKTLSGTTYTSPLDAIFENFTAPVDEKGNPVEAVEDPFFRFVTPFAFPENGWSISTYPYIRLSASGNANVLINEVVFLGEVVESASDTTGTGEMRVIPAKIAEATPYANESAEEAAARAEALLDAQRMPSGSQSSFGNFKTEELSPLMTLAEMRMGGQYAADANGGPVDTYRLDLASGALGIDFLALGTLMFGMSPFGLRFFPMLFSLVALVAFSRFTARLLKSEKAGFAFALLFALSCISLGLAQLGIPLMIAIGFFAVSLDLVHRFYAKGMKGTAASALPLLAAGLCGAAAICVSGPFVLPVAGVAALFALGLVRQQKAKAYRLAQAAAGTEETEEAEELKETAEAKEATERGREVRVAAAKAEFRFKNAAAPAFFFTGLLLGAFLLALLGMLPTYFVYLKYYAGPDSGANVFGLAWHSFANGFTGNYGVARAESWNFFHTVYRGGGSLYAVTGVVVNLAAMAAALLGIAFAAVRLDLALFSKEKGKARRAEIRASAIPLAGLLVSIVAAAALPYALGFLVLAYSFAFVLAAKAWTQMKGRAQTAVGVTWAVLLGVFFALSAVFVFSVPLPARFMDLLFA